MEFAAVVAEYNPFHSGHRYQLEEIRRRGGTHIAAVMSGNVVQRGEVACFCKQTRARAAILGGADLVLELPAIYACASAERFAQGAVQTLSGLGIPGTLWFGSECGDTESLLHCAEALKRVDGSPELKALLRQGSAFAAARCRALEDIAGAELADILKTPNNILAVEYIRAIEGCGAPLKPAAIQRIGAAHDSSVPQETAASASFLREAVRTEGINSLRAYVPPEAFALYEKDMARNLGGASMDALEQVILYHLRTLSAEQFASLPDVQEGLEYRIRDAVRQASSLSGLLALIKSKRYALSRVRRILLYAMLGITREVSALKPGYLRVLAFNERGREVLRAAKKSGSLPVYHSFARLERDFPVRAEKEALASSLFCAALPQPGGGGLSEYRDPRPCFVHSQEDS